MSRRYSRFLMTGTVVGVSLFSILPGCSHWIRDYIPEQTPHLSEEIVLPTRDCGDFFIVDAMIDGQGPYALIVDTGFSKLVLSVKTDQELERSGTMNNHVGRMRVGEFEVVTFDMSP